MTGTDRVTVVVMSHNRREELLCTLPRHEAPVILVDNGSGDETPAAVRAAMPSIEVIELPHNAGAVARNAGVEAAQTPYVAFADDDSWWAPGALRRAAGVFDGHPRLAVLAGRILVGEDRRPDDVSAHMATAPLGRSADLPGPDVLGFVACGAIVRRSAFLAAGGFDPVVHFPGEEERLALDLAALGWGLAYVDDVVAHHVPSPSRGNAGQRAVLIRRNALLTAVMRRPWPVVAAEMAKALAAGGAERKGALAALPRLRAAMARRRPVPPDVEAMIRTLRTG